MKDVIGDRRSSRASLLAVSRVKRNAHGVRTMSDGELRHH